MSISRPSKRRRKNATIGAPSEADSASNQINSPSSSALSTRTLPTTAYGIPSLTSLCARVFVSSFWTFSSNPHIWEPGERWGPMKEQLKSFPDNIVSKIFAMLRMTCPHLLSHDLVRETFLRGDTLKLTSSLPVNKTTVGAVINMGSGLIHLELIGFDTILDKGFAAVVTHLTSLRVLNLRGCTKVGQKTVETAAKCCPNLTTVNLNYTSVSPVSLVPLLLTCQKHLEVLKLAGISSWTDTTVVKALSLLPQGGALSFPALRTLKLRQTSLTDISLNLLLPSCPALRRLDISFTGIRHPHQFIQGSGIALEKLSLTSTAVSSDFLVTAISCIPSLRILSIGALGGGPGQAPAIRNTTAMNLADDALSCLVDVLDPYDGLESTSLVGNTKLGMTGGRNRALADFVARIGRRLKVLNLAGIPSLRSEDLIGLLVDNAGQEPSRLQELILNNTAVGDDAAPYISSCSSLETLEVAGTKFTSRGLFTIVDACTLLTKLDLTSCRGVRIVDRRRFFQVWEEEQKDT